MAQDSWGVQSVEDDDQGGWGVAEIEENPKKKKKDPWAVVDGPDQALAAPASPTPGAASEPNLFDRGRAAAEEALNRTRAALPGAAAAAARLIPKVTPDLIPKIPATPGEAFRALQPQPIPAGASPLKYMNPMLAAETIGKKVKEEVGQVLKPTPAKPSWISDTFGTLATAPLAAAFGIPPGLFHRLEKTVGDKLITSKGQALMREAVTSQPFAPSDFQEWLGMEAPGIIAPAVMEAFGALKEFAITKPVDYVFTHKDIGDFFTGRPGATLSLEATEFLKTVQAKDPDALYRAIKTSGDFKVTDRVPRFGGKPMEVHLPEGPAPEAAAPGWPETFNAPVVAGEKLDPWGVKSVGPVEGEGLKPLSEGEIPVQEAPTALGEKTAPQSTPQAPPAPAQTPSGGPAQPRLFPAPKISSYSSVSQHPDFVKLTDDAQKIVEKYVTNRNVAPTPEFSEKLFGEMHDALGEIIAAPKEKRIEVAKSLKERYPDLKNEFITLKRKLYSDTSEGYFERYVAGKYGDFRPKVASEPPPQAITNAESFKQAWAKANPNVKPEQLDAINSGLLDARAQTWSKMTGKPPEEWFKSRFAKIKKGTGQPDLALGQEAGRPGAVFIGYQEMGEGAPPIALYNVRGISKSDPFYDSTVSAETLDKKGIPVPSTPKLEEYQSFVKGLPPNTGRTTANQAVIEKWGNPEFFQQATPAPIFYSTLQRTLEQKMPNAASPEQIKGILAQGVKQEEIEWSGLDQFLEGKQKVSKQELLDFLKSNEVQIQEVEKGQGSAFTPEQQARYDDLAELAETEGLNNDEEIELNELTRELRAKEAIGATSGNTKFGQYQLPGGENYRELLLTLPIEDKRLEEISLEKFGRSYSTLDAKERVDVKRDFNIKNPGEFAADKEGFRSSHFDEPNILAHIRFNDRTGPNGEKILFIEEVQSDWHQKGRMAGYKGIGSNEAVVDSWLKEKGSNLNTSTVSHDVLDKMGAPQNVIDAYLMLDKKWGAAVPNAPFKKTWPELAMKRMLRYATENGYDKIAWTTGAQQAERYDLSKQVDQIAWKKNEDGTVGISVLKNDQVVLEKDHLNQTQLSETIGKDIASKIAADQRKEWAFSGLDLKVGGEGMKGFYDQILPSFLNKYTKKWGGRVGEMTISSGNDHVSKTPDGRFALADENGVDTSKTFATELEAERALGPNVHSLDITSTMKESVSQGQPLFQGPKGSVSFDAEQKAIISAFEKADVSTVIHELGHVFRRDLYRTSGEALPEYRAQLKADMATAENWAGVEGGQWNREAEEKWARGFEHYITTGQAPNKALQHQYDMFSDWMRQVYGSVIGSAINVQVSPQVREVFDRLFTPETARQTEAKDIARQLKEEASMPLFQEEGPLYQEDVPKPGQEGFKEDPRKTVQRIQERAKRDMARVKIPSRETAPKRYTEAAALRRSLQRQAYAAAEAAAEVEKQAAYEARFKEAESKSILDWKIAEAKGLAKNRAARIVQIKKEIQQEINRLPLSERGRFTSAIVNAQTPRQVLKVIARVDDALENFQRRTLTHAIRQQFRRLTASKSIDVEYIQKIRKVMNGITTHQPRAETLSFLGKVQSFIDEKKALGENVVFPQYIMDKIRYLSSRPLALMPVPEIEDIFNQITTLAELGRQKLRDMDSVLSTQKEKDLADLLASTQTINLPEVRRAQPGEDLAIPQEFLNVMGKRWGTIQNTHYAITPQDVIFDIMDGNQGHIGPNARIFKRRFDMANNDAMNFVYKIEQEFAKIGKGMKEKSMERIGVHAAVSQENGYEKLIQTGVTPETISSIKLTPEEKRVYQYMRKVLDDLRPHIVKYMSDTFNAELGNVEHYFPFATDWELTAESTVRDRMLQEMLGFRKNPPKGMTITRVKGGTQKLKLNAADVFLRHIRDVSYLIHLGPVTKYLGELAAMDAYKQKAGTLGQLLVREWIDTVARGGHTMMDQQSRILNYMGKNIGIAALGVRLTTSALQLTTLLQGAALIGPYSFKGAYNIVSPKWRKFIIENMSEIRESMGDDPAFRDFKGDSWMDKYARGVMSPIAFLDLVSRTAVASGAYEKYMADHKMILDFERPNRDAIAWAQLMVRRTQASSHFKDVPSALSRGRFSGNVSLDRAWFKFQNFNLNDWSLLTHEGFRQGLFKGNYRQGVNVLFWLTMSALAMVGIRGGIDRFLGKEPSKKDEDMSLKEKVFRQMLFNVPFLGQAYSMAVYGSSGIPAIDVLTRTASGIYRSFKEQKPPTSEKDRKKKAASKAKAMIDAATGIGTLIGLPLPTQLAEIIKRKIDKDAKASPAGAHTVKLRAAKTNTVKIRAGK